MKKQCDRTARFYRYMIYLIIGMLLGRLLNILDTSGDFFLIHGDNCLFSDQLIGKNLRESLV